MCTPEDGRPAFRVLVLDPSPFLAERLARLARSCGPVAVELAASGEEALAALRRHPSTVVLAAVDRLTWPALPELEAVRDVAPNTCLIALTDAMEPELAHACWSRGAELVLDLHADTGLLRQLLRELCRAVS